VTLPDDPSIEMNQTNTVAFILDGKVVQVDKVGVYYAAVLTSDDVTVMNVTHIENADNIVKGYVYDPIRNTFTEPVI